MTTDWCRFLLVDGPSSIVDSVVPAIVQGVDRLNRDEQWLRQLLAPLWRAYWMLIAAASILCLTTTVLWLVAALLHVPLPPPEPGPVLPAGGRASVAPGDRSPSSRSRSGLIAAVGRHR